MNSKSSGKNATQTANIKHLPAKDKIGSKYQSVIQLPNKNLPNHRITKSFDYKAKNLNKPQLYNKSGIKNRGNLLLNKCVDMKIKININSK